MFAPILEVGSRTIILQNFAIVRDDSTGKKDVVTMIAKSGAELIFENEDAADILAQIEKLVKVADKLRLPIVGFDNTVLLLFNFLMFEDQSDEDENRVVITDTDSNDHTFTGKHAALILSRVDTLAQGTKEVMQRLSA